MFARLPEGQAATIDVWLVVPPPEVKARAAEAQRAFAHLDWLAPLPGHFLHLTLGRGDGAAPAEWEAVEPFRIEYGGVGCFHEAVIGEVRGEGLHRLASALQPGDLEFFLAHLSIAYVHEPRLPGELREMLRPLRDARLGEQLVDEVLLVRVPFSRTTLLEPWTVLRRIPFRPRR
jgi:2'-5' RNA ligase